METDAKAIVTRADGRLETLSMSTVAHQLVLRRLLLALGGLLSAQWLVAAMPDPNRR